MARLLPARQATIGKGETHGYGLFGGDGVDDASLIGIDVGTTAVKAVLVDLKGRRLAEFEHHHPTGRPEPGAAEQDPEGWMAGVLGALRHFEAVLKPASLAGIGICSQVNSHVFVDAAGKAVLPAITWQDGRAAPDAAAIDARVSLAEKLAWFGGPVPIDASHALSRIAYVARVAPDAFARTRHVLLPKDFCALQLTGEVASDPVSAVGLVNRSGYVAPLLALAPRAAELLPPLCDFTHVIGPVTAGLPCAGAPVVVGAMDAWGGMFGVGVAAEGEAMLQSGTSEIAGMVSSTVSPTPGVVLFPPYQGITMHAAPTQSGGAALAWFAKIADRSPAETAALGASAPPSSAVPLFLPHLEGERAPIWDSFSRGVFARMDGRAGPAEMARAVLEGVALSVRWAFEALYSSTGSAPGAINTGGGGSRSNDWCQIKADTLGLPLRRAAVPEAAAIGAAILAGIGSGAMPSLTEAIHALVRFDRIFEPNPALAGYYADRFADYRSLYEALRPFNATRAGR
jgi:xylulokinase